MAILATIKQTFRQHPVLGGLAILIGVLVGLTIISISTGGKPKGGGKHDRGETPVVIVAPLQSKDIPIYLDGLGTVQASSTVTVHTQVDGQLIEVLFREGQDVSKGDVLARIDPRTYQAQLDQAKANKARDTAQLANARIDLQRYVGLGDMIPGQTTATQRSLVGQLEATVQSDQAAMDNARILLGYTTITAPISGRTGLRQVDAGNIVHASDPNGLVVITQLEPITILFSLPQQNLQDINSEFSKQGALKVLAMENNGNHTIMDTGTLNLVDNQIDQTTGTIRLKTTFPNSKRLLWPGGFVNVRLLLTTRHNALTIPAVAVQRGPKDSYVFVLKDDKTVEMRIIKIAMIEDQDAIIDSGLKMGEQVVVDGAGKLQDGSKVMLPGDVKTDKAGDGKADGKQGHKGKKDSE